MPAISDLLDSDMENNSHFVDENSLISSVSDTTSIAQTKATAAKKPRKRKCVTMPKKPRATKTAVKTEADLPAPKTGAKRKAKLIEDVADEDDICEVQAPETKVRSSKSSKDKDVVKNNSRTTKARSSKQTAPPNEIENEEAFPSPVVVRSNFAIAKPGKSVPKPITQGASKKTATAKGPKAVSKVANDVPSDLEDEDADVAQPQPPRKKARTDSRPRQEPSYRRRAGSASDTERGDPMLRRKLGDVTRKYENMDMKYRNLKEVAVSEANTNFEKLQKECDNIKAASAKLVGSLKQELTHQAPMIQEYRKLKKDAQNYESDSKRFKAAEHDLSTKLAAAQNEIKSLQAKLLAAKAAQVPVETKAIATTHKHASQPAKPVMGANNEAAQKQQLKLDLYSDLTGLIIRDVKQNEDGDTYDCIQTGREGRALHFKLFIDQEEAKKPNHDEQEFLYTPFLDASRDRDLIEVMPSYLSEDITFARDVAARFYGRVVETVMKKTDLNADEESE